MLLYPRLVEMLLASNYSSVLDARRLWTCCRECYYRAYYHELDYRC
jgi:hypothetical protein